ncbi:MAG TPA: hypothetical protein VHH73_09345, partial [Verrucomicrobiae bacterium]|nr:hypothetical protein [Verrucomicrobiae bacterium]
ATLALMTEVGPPDCATNKLPVKSDIIVPVWVCPGEMPQGRSSGVFPPKTPRTLPTAPGAVKAELAGNTAPCRRATPPQKTVALGGGVPQVTARWWRDG